MYLMDTHPLSCWWRAWNQLTEERPLGLALRQLLDPRVSEIMMAHSSKH